MEPAGGEINQILSIAPAVWPGRAIEVQPGDLSRFVPAGLGLGAPLVMRPWDKIDDLTRRPDFYGFNEPSSHPFFNAPVNDAAGGVVYFDGRPRRERVDGLLELLEVRGLMTEYAVFWAAAAKPLEERYLEQLRIVAPGALTGLFGIEPAEESRRLVQQKLTVSEALWAFIEQQRQKYRSAFALSGVMGGDGDWAKETLAFGFMVENSYHAVYRIWSRAWLVTK